MNKSTTIQNADKCDVDISRHFALMYEIDTYVRTIESLIFIVLTRDMYKRRVYMDRENTTKNHLQRQQIWINNMKLIIKVVKLQRPKKLHWSKLQSSGLLFRFGAN
jgi:hypothetical protein